MLLEARWGGMCDEVWCVAAPHASIVSRLGSRNGLSEEAAEARIGKQMGADERLARSHVALSSALGEDDLRAQASRIHQQPSHAYACHTHATRVLAEMLRAGCLLASAARAARRGARRRSPAREAHPRRPAGRVGGWHLSGRVRERGRGAVGGAPVVGRHHPLNPEP